MFDEPQRPGWWQASDGNWYPPEQAPGLPQHPRIHQAPDAHIEIPAAPQGEKTNEVSMATQRSGASHADATGATLIVVGIVGGIAWTWQVVRTQFFIDEPDSLAARLDLLAAHTPILLLSGAVAGLGIGLRSFAATQTGFPARSALGRPIGPMLLVVAATLVMFLGGAAIVGDHDDSTSELDALHYDVPSIDDSIPVTSPTVVTPNAPPELTYTLELHSDGCGVFRSGSIGDDLTWVFKDQDGFQVLGRNAAGEIQYRYFRPGTYTVVLEAWGGGHYVAVSNEITVTC